MPLDGERSALPLTAGVVEERAGGDIADGEATISCLIGILILSNFVGFWGSGVGAEVEEPLVNLKSAGAWEATELARRDGGAGMGRDDEAGVGADLNFGHSMGTYGFVRKEPDCLNESLPSPSCWQRQNLGSLSVTRSVSSVSKRTEQMSRRFETSRIDRMGDLGISISSNQDSWTEGCLPDSSPH